MTTLNFNPPLRKMEHQNGEESGGWIGLGIFTVLTTYFNEHSRLLAFWLDWDFVGSLIRTVIIAGVSLGVTFFGKKFLNKYFPDKNKKD